MREDWGYAGNVPGAKGGRGTPRTDRTRLGRFLPLMSTELARTRTRDWPDARRPSRGTNTVMNGHAARRGPAYAGKKKTNKKNKSTDIQNVGKAYPWHWRGTRIESGVGWRYGAWGEVKSQPRQRSRCALDGDVGLWICAARGFLNRRSQVRVLSGPPMRYASY